MVDLSLSIAFEVESLGLQSNRASTPQLGTNMGHGQGSRAFKGS